MKKIIAIPGSLRKGSFNLALLRAARELAPQDVEIEIASIEGIPLYNGDDEDQSGVPAAVSALKERIVAADGLIIATPEYNHSIPGVLKNATDWLTRPSGEAARVFGDKPVAIVGVSSGPIGTRLAQAAWLPVLRSLGTRPWFGSQMFVGPADQVFDANGRLIDERLAARLAKFLSGFSRFIDSGR